MKDIKKYVKIILVVGIVVLGGKLLNMFTPISGITGYLISGGIGGLLLGLFK